MNPGNTNSSESGNSENRENIPHQTLEVEIINPDGSREKVDPGRGRQWRTSGNRTYGAAWNFAPMDNTGCAAAMVTLFLFVFCLSQFGALAAIGFLVFHTAGSVMGSIHFARRLLRGLPLNVWTWRVGNWIISFLLVAFLSGYQAG